MVDRIFDSGWVERYVLNQLSEDDEMAFEEALFGSEDLRRDVEAALALQSVLTLDERMGEEPSSGSGEVARLPPAWQPLATAASLLAGALGLVMWYSSSLELASLRGQISELNRTPQEVVIKRIDLTRSSGPGSGTPVRKPAGDALLVLDIELSPGTIERERVRVDLINDGGQVIASWSGDTMSRDRVSMGVRSGHLPDNGALSLEFRSPGGELLETLTILIVTDS